MLHTVLHTLSVRSCRVLRSVLWIACAMLSAAALLLVCRSTYEASAAAAALLRAIIPLFLFALVRVAFLQQQAEK